MKDWSLKIADVNKAVDQLYTQCSIFIPVTPRTPFLQGEEDVKNIPYSAADDTFPTKSAFLAVNIIS
ncbi:hypothetical protein [Nitrosococcus oceani]|nr:hypothetical protein [Nitrosococcus oceani]GEM18751.1 hypothetical protein NONS58_01100 [Nitrosococcus oceani]